MEQVTKKSQENQRFTTIDLILTISIMFTVITIAGPIIFNSLESSRLEKGKKQTASLAREAALLGDAFTSQRSLASENTALHERPLGIDPWSRPYKRAIVPDEKGKPAYVVVWSSGPNGITETQKIHLDQHGVGLSVRFGGDDFGTIAPIE